MSDLVCEKSRKGLKNCIGVVLGVLSAWSLGWFEFGCFRLSQPEQFPCVAVSSELFVKEVILEKLPDECHPICEEPRDQQQSLDGGTDRWESEAVVWLGEYAIEWTA